MAGIVCLFGVAGGDSDNVLSESLRRMVKIELLNWRRRKTRIELANATPDRRWTERASNVSLQTL